MNLKVRKLWKMFSKTTVEQKIRVKGQTRGQAKMLMVYQMQNRMPG
ncbi:hypothetical protein [Blautia hominis]